MGKTVEQLQQSISQEEFEAWREFYIRWPFDDLHRYHRPAALVSVSLGGGKLEERVEILQPPVRDPDQEFDFWSCIGK